MRLAAEICILHGGRSVLPGVLSICCVDERYDHVGWAKGFCILNSRGEKDFDPFATAVSLLFAPFNVAFNAFTYLVANVVPAEGNQRDAEEDHSDEKPLSRAKCVASPSAMPFHRFG